MKRIYLDNGATTKVDGEVIEAMNPYFNKYYGNPSSLHSFGKDAEEAIEKSKQTIKTALNAKEEDKLIFTGSATEANNMALISFARANKDKGNHIITTLIEHNAIINPTKKLQKEGFKITYLGVDEEGFIRLDELEKAISKETILVSIIHSNHEIGTIQDLTKIGGICKKHNITFHTDAAQSLTKVPVDVQKSNIDMVSLNAHKIHGPKGIGALYLRKGIKLDPIITGGPQEQNLRAGTENIPLIVGFAKAVEIGIRDMEKNHEKMSELRDYLIEELIQIPDTFLNGTMGDKRAPNNVNLSFDFIEGESMLVHLDLEGIAISTGSACSSKSLKPSSILTAIGNCAQLAHGSLRFTLSKYTTKEEIDYTIKKVKEVVTKLRKLSPLIKA